MRRCPKCYSTLRTLPDRFKLAGRTAIDPKADERACFELCSSRECRASLSASRCRDELDYPFHDRTVTITHCGRICLGKRKINLSTVFAGQNVGVKEVSDKIWLVTFMHYDLAFVALKRLIKT